MKPRLPQPITSPSHELNEKRAAAIAIWLSPVEKAFAAYGRVFEILAAGGPGPDEPATLARVARELEARTRQLRALMTTVTPPSIM